MVDYFLYNGVIDRGDDLKFIDMISSEKSSEEAVLILVTPGGSPDAAYKIARYIQSKYSNFSLIISGYCKSAGTLLSIGANELIFMPYGELGPLDVQITKTDNISAMESGLNTSEAFLSLEERARQTYHNMLTYITASSGGIVSFPTASKVATDMITSMYGPIFSRIDPEEVGSRSRAMRIGEDYGVRLNEKWNNLKPNMLEMLSQTYSSHGFVIDKLEASALFERVRDANEDEERIVKSLGSLAIHPQQELTIRKIDTSELEALNGKQDENHSAPQPTSAVGASRKLNGADSSGTKPSSSSSTSSSAPA